MSREWFEWYCGQLDKQKSWAKFRDRFLCPCCYMPTLDERAGYDICSICCWEDDGQDSDDADIARGGPNKNYSLTEARNNFMEHGAMYRPSDNHHFERTQRDKGKRAQIYAAFQAAIRSGTDEDWNAAIVMEKYI